MSQPDYIGLVLEAFDYIDRACCALAASCDPCEVRPCPCRDCELVHCPGRGKGECPATADVYGDPLPELDVGDLFDEGDEGDLHVRLGPKAGHEAGHPGRRAGHQAIAGGCDNE